jgi:hypothetical protein
MGQGTGDFDIRYPPKHSPSFCRQLTFVLMCVYQPGVRIMSRLTIDITDQQHQSLKAMAALEGKTIKQYALERLFPAGADDQAWRELQTLLNERIANGLAGKLSPKTFEQIVDDEMTIDRKA